MNLVLTILESETGGIEFDIESSLRFKPAVFSIFNIPKLVIKSILYHTSWIN